MKFKYWIASVIFFAMISSEVSFAGSVPRPEHPRPDLARESWQNLNGQWFFQEDPHDRGISEQWFLNDRLAETITVPFEIESPLSGIGRQNPSEVFWYVKSFELDKALAGKRVILHFGAVDYRATVWLNGSRVGSHKGGYSPFSFDVTESLMPGTNLIAVRVFDSKSVKQVRGKQTWKDKGFSIVYTATSGIWQTVWLEAVGSAYIIRYETFTDLDAGVVRFRVYTDGPDKGLYVCASIKDPGGRKLPSPKKVLVDSGCTELVWKVDDPKLWRPEDPNLYDLEFRLEHADAGVVDRVKTYAGLRTIETGNGEVLLNGEPIYQKLLLVQGYFTPKAIYSPASDEDFRKDVEAAKQMGFNGARIHQKIEDPRYYYWCDKLGFLIWEEMPSIIFWRISRLVPGRESRDQFKVEMKEMIRRDFNHPSVIVWTIFNESWGLHDAMFNPFARTWWLECVDLAHELDPTRLVVDNSGWLHRKTDIFDVHHYLPTAEKSEEFYKKLEKPWGTRCALGHTIMNAIKGMPVVSPLFWGAKYNGEPVIISEYGGFGFYKTQEKSLLDNYREYTRAIAEYPYIKGYCYTQQYDIEQEANGLQKENRDFKVPPEQIKKINDSIGLK